jgi:hypothetical protein
MNLATAVAMVQEKPKVKRGKPIGYAVVPWRRYLKDDEPPIGKYNGPLGTPIDKEINDGTVQDHGG